MYLDSVLQDTERSFMGVTVLDEGLYKIITEYVAFHQEAIRDFVYEESRRMSSQGVDPVVHMSSNMIFTTKSGQNFSCVLHQDGSWSSFRKLV